MPDSKLFRRLYHHSVRLTRKTPVQETRFAIAKAAWGLWQFRGTPRSFNEVGFPVANGKMRVQVPHGALLRQRYSRALVANSLLGKLCFSVKHIVFHAPFVQTVGSRTLNSVMAVRIRHGAFGCGVVLQNRSPLK